MKSIFKQTLLTLAALLAALANTKAAVFTNLYSFKAMGTNSSIPINQYTNNNGAYPFGGLICSSNIIYGTTFKGGIGGNGTVFKVNNDGTGFTNLHSFSILQIPGTNYDGAESEANLVLSNNTLYGTAYGGGVGGNGTIFKVNTDGTGFTNLYSFSTNSGPPSFTNRDGASPSSGLTLSGNALYGTSVYGGSAGNGTIFRINTDGTSFTNLHNFTAISDSTNADGANPQTGCALSGNTLYGTTQHGGSGGEGTIFKVNTDGSGFTNLYNFAAVNNNTNSNGAGPIADLALSSNTLYGTTQIGGSGGEGTVFKVNTDGTGFTNLYNFSTFISNTNSDGANPSAFLVLFDNTLYGTAQSGGNGGEGTIFKLNTDGTGFTNLYNFSTLISNTNSDGANPTAFLVLSGNTLYGTASMGGIEGSGTLFALNLPPPNLNIRVISSAAVLSWSNPNFSLQAAPTVVGVYTNMPGATSPYTNAFTGSQKFFRLQVN